MNSQTGSKLLPSDHEYLLKYFDTLPSDDSDEDFEGYIDEDEGRCKINILVLMLRLFAFITEIQQPASSQDDVEEMPSEVEEGLNSVPFQNTLNTQRPRTFPHSPHPFQYAQIDTQT